MVRSIIRRRLMLLAQAAMTGALLAMPTTANRVEARQEARTIEVTARRFTFSPDRIEVTEGDMVTLVVHSADTTHGLKIRALKIAREIPRNGQRVTIAFTAGAPGTYDITCSEYCGRGHDDMSAVLVVTPRARPGTK